MQQCLYLRPLPQGQGSFLPIFARAWRGISLRHYRAGVWKGKGHTGRLFFREENQRVQINGHGALEYVRILRKLDSSKRRLRQLASASHFDSGEPGLPSIGEPSPPLVRPGESPAHGRGLRSPTCAGE